MNNVIDLSSSQAALDTLYCACVRVYVCVCGGGGGGMQEGELPYSLSLKKRAPVSSSSAVQGLC